MTDRLRFDEKVTRALAAAVKAAAADCPELEAVGLVLLWRYPDQSSLPGTMLVGADGPVHSPDQLMRLMQAVNQLQRFLLEGSVAGVQALRDMAHALALGINAHESPTSEAESDGLAATPTDATPP